jgi:N-terminal acetyltransferase 2
VSNVQKVIPQNVQDKWHEFRQGKKEASQEESAVPEGKEVVGWGVKEADARTAQEGASEFVPTPVGRPMLTSN